MKDLLRTILVMGVKVGAFPLAIYLTISMNKSLSNFGKASMKIGGRAAAPIGNAARNRLGAVSNWAAGRGILGRTVGRVLTGNVLPGGRSSMERAGTAYTKQRSERQAARGGYRVNLRGNVNPDALERATPDAINTLVERARTDNRAAQTLAAMRRMAHETPTLRLSTAQRDALFGGSGADFTNPTTGAPEPAVPVPVGTPGRTALGNAAGTGPIPIGPSPRTGPLRPGDWWGDRPNLTPGRRTSQQRFGQATLTWLTDWRSFVARPFRPSQRSQRPAPGTQDIPAPAPRDQNVWPGYRP